MNRRLLAGLFLSLGVLWSVNAAQPPLAHNPASASQRLAVLSTASVQTTGLADLLTAEFSKGDGVALVERAELEKVVTEQGVADLFASRDVHDRIQMGTLLKADYLLLLSKSNGTDSPLLKWVLVESRTGSRLCVGQVPLAVGMENLSREICQGVSTTLSRFPGGVKTVIGVSPFLSRVLVHDFDYLQDSLAALLGNTLAASRGVAVMEVEEAEAIREELALSGANEISRIVPLFVQAEFDCPPSAAGSNTLFNFKVRITDGTRVLASPAKASLLSSSAALWVQCELAADILALARAGKAVPLSAEEQFATLTQRAEQFARIADTEHSTSLREAALLVKDEAIQRKLLVAEYRRLVERRFQDFWRREKESHPSREETETHFDRAVSVARLASRHVDYLVYNRMINTKEFLALGEDLKMILWNTERTHSPQSQLFLLEWRQHLVASVPYVINLPPERSGQADSAYTRRRIATLLLEEEEGLSSQNEDLALALLERIPPQFPPPSELAYRMNIATDSALRRGADPGGQRHSVLLEHFEKSSNGLYRVYARYSRLWAKDLQDGRANQPALASDLQAADTLIRQHNDYCQEYGIPDSERGPMNTMLADLHRSIDRRLTSVARAPEPLRPPEVHASMGRLRMTEIPFQLKKLNGRTELWEGQRWPFSGGLYSIQQWRHCATNLDVAWSRGALLMHRIPGLLEEVQVDSRSQFDDVCWDGKHLWLATCHSGLWVLDADGRLVAKLAREQGLPPADAGMKLHAMAPGKVLAVGSFERGWCALIDYQPTWTNINVFHTATRIRTVAEGSSDARTLPEFAFTPKWTFLYEDEQGLRNRLIVGLRKNPLEINLETLQVSASELPMPGDMHRADAYFNRRGELLQCSDFEVTHYAAPGRTLFNGETRRAFCIPRNKEGTKNGGLRKQILPYDGFLYVPGLIWYRIDPQTMKEEQLCPDRLPRLASDQDNFGVAIHYGLLGWAYGKKFYQFDVSSEPQ